MSQTPHSVNTSTCAETRQRLLDAASTVFAEVGFYEATVREICRRAGANIAAINYHFGDKEQLYLEVLRSGSRRANEQYPIFEDIFPAELPAPERLRIFVRTVLSRLLDSSRMATHGKLMAREMIEPTPALEILLGEVILPISDILRGIVGEILGTQAGDRAVRLCSASILGQCVYYRHCQPVIARLLPGQVYEAADIEELAEHIIRFSLGALDSYSETQNT